jgi:uncharacterized protein (TIGR02597 family)
MKVLPLITAAVLIATSAFAQNATTIPVGAMTINFPATGTSPATTSTYFSIPLHADPAFTGKPTAVTSTTMTFSGVNWTTSPKQFGATPATYIARVMSGQQAGRILQITDNTSTAITVSTTDRTLQTTDLTMSGFAVTSNDTVEIVPCDTLAGLFGDGTTNNPLLLAAGANTFVADTVSLQDRITGKTTAYFFNNSSGVNQWRRGTVAVNCNNIPIYPDDAILVLRRTNRAASQLVLTGRVPSVAPLLKSLPGGYNLGSLGLPVDLTVQNLNLSGGWTNGNNLFTADTLSLYNAASGKFVAYFKRSTDGTWRNSASASAADVSSTVIPAGAPVGILERTSTVSGAQSFNRVSLPYSL